MNEVKLILKLAKVIRTPEQAIALFVVSGLGIVIAYKIPADLFQ